MTLDYDVYQEERISFKIVNILTAFRENISPVALSKIHLLHNVFLSKLLKQQKNSYSEQEPLTTYPSQKQTIKNTPIANIRL